MKICKDVQDWIEEEVEETIVQQERRCKKWPWPLSWLCSLVTWIIKVVVTVWKKILRVVCEIVSVAWNVAAAVFNFALALPVIGPLIKAALRLLTWVVSLAFGLADAAGRLVGIRTTKHLRVHVVPLCEGNVPLAYATHLEPIMRETERIFHERAGIRVHTTYHEPVPNPPDGANRLGALGDLVLDEAWWKGSWHQLQTVKMFESNVWSLFAVGHPIVVYIVREVGYDGPGTVVGVSAGPFTDWIAVERNSAIQMVAAAADGTTPATPITPFPPPVAGGAGTSGVVHPQWNTNRFNVAHEIGHALGLMGHLNSEPGNLMEGANVSGDALSPFQVGLIRSSAHVTYL